jgi:8-oxo-dGTP diphosphatase
MKMNHFVLGLVFNQTKDKVLLIEKRRPAWMAGKWNGIGGHIEEDETPMQAMKRECLEEIGVARCDFEHKITFVCPGGTVYVFAAICSGNRIPYKQIEDEQLSIWSIPGPEGLTMENLRWIIPLCLSSVQFPVLLQQNELGVV